MSVSRMITASVVCFGVKRNRIASPGHPHGLCVDRSGAVLANHAVRSLVEPNRAANLAGIKHSRNFAVRFLIKPEANRAPILLGLETVQVAIGNLGQRNTELAVC